MPKGAPPEPKPGLTRVPNKLLDVWMPYKYAEDYKVSTAIESTPACVGTNKRLESKEIEKKYKFRDVFEVSLTSFRQIEKLTKRFSYYFLTTCFGNLCLYI